MEETVFNPQKTRLETIQVEYKKENTTWFEEYTNNQDIYRITDFDGGLLIKEWDYSYPVWVYDVSRAEINNDQEKAKEIRAQCLEEYK
jgi:prophage tail gpP-like protein